MPGEVGLARKNSTAKELMPMRASRAARGAAAQLLDELRDLIRQTREGVARAVDCALVLLYWRIGVRIRTEILKSRRATYGAEICSTLSNELTVEFGRGFSRPNLTRMI